MNSTKRLLLFKIKTFCYNSPFYFVDETARCFRKMGWTVDVFDTATQPLTDLDLYTGQHYDAILDFNSQLPKVDTTEDEYYLDTIDAPFYNYILDHPLYHHDMLKHELRNFHVVCLDYNHAEYIKQWYPHIQSVHVLPLAGSAYGGEIPPIASRPMPLLFTGTYTSPEHILDLVRDYGGQLQTEMFSLIERLRNKPHLTMEEAYADLLHAQGFEHLPDFFSRRMHLYFLVSTYITGYFREQVVLSLAKKKVPMTLIGHGWDKAKSIAPYTQLTIRPPVDFGQTFASMAQAKMVLNVMPWFKQGMHDRIYSTMANGAVSLSDESGYFTDRYLSGRDLLIYSLEDLDSMADTVLEYLENPQKLQEIATQGQKIAVDHTWDAHSRLLKNIFLN